MIKLYLIVFINALYLALTAQPTGNRLTLQQCVETAIQNNLQVGQSNLQLQESEILMRQARLNRLPNLNAFISQGINQGRSIDPFTNAFVDSRLGFGNYGLSSGVVLFNGGTLQHTVAQNRLSFEAAEMELQQVKDDLTINIILAYLQVLTNEDILTQIREQALLTRQQVERLEMLNRDGAIPPSQLSDLQGQYAGDQLAVINAQNALETSRLTLCQLMNIPYDESLSLERIDTEPFTGLYEATAGSIYQTALSNFARIKAVDLRTASAERGVKVQKGQLYPILRFGVNVVTNYSSAASLSTFTGSSTIASSDFVNISGAEYPVIRQVSHFTSDKIPYERQLTGNLFSSIGFNLSIPIFNSLQQRNRIKLAELAVKNNEVIAKTARTQLEQAIDLAWINLKAALDRHNVLLDQVTAFEESFRAAEIRFEQGVGNSIDYLTAKNNLGRTNLSSIVARYDFVLRTKVLDYYQGKRLW